MAISKRLRFEILRRDGFTCRYCGSGENLTVDHVVPTALGGSDEPSNLTTACRDCNAGKSATPADAALVADVAQDALRWARAMDRAIDSAWAELTALDELHVDFVKTWNSYMPARWSAPPVEWMDTFDKIVRAGLPWFEIERAIRTAAGASHVPVRKRWSYFCGVCWNKVADLQRRAQDILQADED